MLLTPVDDFTARERSRTEKEIGTAKRPSGKAELRLRLIMSHLYRTQPRVYRDMLEQFDWE